MIAPWAKDEMATGDFGDERLDARAVMVLSTMGRRPTLSIPAACAGRAEIQATYRFFDNDKVTFEKTLASHIQCRRQRAAEQPTVLLVQDTSEVDVTRPEQEVAGTEKQLRAQAKSRARLTCVEQRGLQPRACWIYPGAGSIVADIDPLQRAMSGSGPKA